MKLKTTLIPASCLGLCGSIITPLTLTSCGNGSAIGRSFDLVKNYYPTIERHKEEILPLYDINEEYAQTILDNPEVFVQDYMWGKCWTGFAFEQFLFWEKLLPESRVVPPDIKNIMGAPKIVYNSDIEVISNLTIKKQTANWKGQDWTFPTLSFTFSFDSKVREIYFQDYYYGGNIYSGNINGYVSGDIKFYNVPFYIIPRTVANQQTGLTMEVLSFEPFYEWMSGTEQDIDKGVQPWEIATSTYSSISGEIAYGSGLSKRIASDWRLNVISDQTNPSWKYESLTLEDAIGRVFATSYYLEQVQLKREAN